VRKEREADTITLDLDALKTHHEDPANGRVVPGMSEV